MVNFRQGLAILSNVFTHLGLVTTTGQQNPQNWSHSLALLIDWHFYNGPRKIDDVLLEYGGLPHVLPLAVHLLDM